MRLVWPIRVLLNLVKSLRENFEFYSRIECEWEDKREVETPHVLSEHNIVLVPWDVLCRFHLAMTRQIHTQTKGTKFIDKV